MIMIIIIIKPVCTAARVVRSRAVLQRGKTCEEKCNGTKNWVKNQAKFMDLCFEEVYHSQTNYHDYK